MSSGLQPSNASDLYHPASFVSVPFIIFIAVKKLGFLERFLDFVRFREKDLSSLQHKNLPASHASFYPEGTRFAAIGRSLRR